MDKPHTIRRITIAIAALGVVGVLALGATACTSATGPTTAPAAQGETAAPASASASAGAASSAGGAPTAAQGQQVVQTRCTGKCHTASQLQRRYSPAQAQAIAADMGRKAGLSANDQVAVAVYFAQ